MITLLYRCLILIVLALTTWNLFSEKKILRQVNAALVLIPLLLRLLMIK
ncbi:hypothetical protein HMPREF9554_02402 [Treponema phagedenis F0421]|nr:hypothetical protein HMPREF9554_02402 [Treponema phagedenis F0421]